MEQPEYRGPIVEPGVDTNRWDLVPSRAGDIIVATASKMGTTWSQMLCALLVHGPDLPRPLAELSPWLDGGAWNNTEGAVEVFNAQTYRRVIKTHTAFHNLKYRPDTFYVTCGRDPRDVFLSSMDHSENSALPGGAPLRDTPLDRTRLFASMLNFDKRRNFADVFDHVASYWRYRSLPNILFLHYSDMSDDLEGELVRLAAFLGIVRSHEEIAALATHARFDAMRAEADDLAPGGKGPGRWKRNADFFRKGRLGEWRDVFSPETQALYVARTRGNYDHAMLGWLENGRSRFGDPRDI